MTSGHTAPPRNWRHWDEYQAKTCLSRGFLEFSTARWTCERHSACNMSWRNRETRNSTYRGIPLKDLCFNFVIRYWTSVNHVLNPIIPWTIARGSNILTISSHRDTSTLIQMSFRYSTPAEQGGGKSKRTCSNNPDILPYEHIPASFDVPIPY